MRAALFIDETSGSWLTDSYLKLLKTRLKTSGRGEISVVEVASKSYLREDFLVLKNGGGYRILFRKGSENTASAERAVRELKRQGFKSQVAVVFGAEQKATFLAAKMFSIAFKRRWFFYPVNSINEELVSADASVLVQNDFAYRHASRMFTSVFRIQEVPCPEISVEEKLIPSPPLSIAVLVDDGEGFGKFRTVAKVLKRLEHLRLLFLGPKDLCRRAREYAELIGVSERLTVADAVNLDEAAEYLSRVNAVLSLSERYLPLDSVISMIAKKPVISFSESPAEEISVLSGGRVIPACMEEAVYDALLGYADFYDFTDFKSAFENMERLTSPENFLRALEQLA